MYPEVAPFGIPADYRAADPGSALGAQHLYLRAPEIQRLAAHHDDEQHWLLLAEPEPFGHPGEDELLALHIRLDHIQRTFATFGTWHSNIAFAQLALIRDDHCPADKIEINGAYAHLRGTDPETLAVNAHIRASGDRYRVEGTYTLNSHPWAEAWTVAEDRRASHEDDPIRVFLDTIHLPTGTYQARNHGFPDLDAAAAWLHDHAPSLPPACHHQAPAAARPRPGTPPAPAPGTSPAARGTTPGR